ncbi:MAG: TetR/AcrR family transcriptional regulator [Candidatus Nanopelagicus sp.]
MVDDKSARLPRDERRAQLLVAALEVFTAAGYHSAAMDEIADRANVSKPVLYQHFPSKLDLYLAVLDLHIDSLVFAIQKAIASNRENSSRVEATVEAYFGFIDSEGEAFRLLFESDMNLEPQVRERLNRMTYDCAAAVSAVISIDTGLGKEESMMLAVGIIGTVQTTARHWLDRDGKIDRRRATELVMNLIWRGISGFPKSQSYIRNAIKQKIELSLGNYKNCK